MINIIYIMKFTTFVDSPKGLKVLEFTMYSNVAVKVLTKKLPTLKVLSPCKSKKFNKRLLMSSQEQAILARAVSQSGDSGHEARPIELGFNTVPRLRFTDGVQDFFKLAIKKFEMEDLLLYLVEIYEKLKLEYTNKGDTKLQVTMDEENDTLNSSSESNSSDVENVNLCLKFLRNILADINMSGGDSFLTEKEKDDLKDIVITTSHNQEQFRRLFEIFLPLHRIFQRMLFS